MNLHSAVNMVTRRFGISISRTEEKKAFPIEFDKADCNIVRYVMQNSLSMASRERLCATLSACKYVDRAGVPGSFVECGVWRGGNSIIAADVFARSKSDNAREIYLFDTFSGMSEPSDEDLVAGTGEHASKEYNKNRRSEFNNWCYASIDEVKSNFRKRDLLDSIHLVKGDVVTTLLKSENLPEKIAVLRLDTDWYESTKCELEILWPRLVRGGVLIIDDYGHWAGARKATDEYFSENAPFLHYIDYTARIAVKL